MLNGDGSGGLQVQLATYRMMDDWEEARRIKDDGRAAYNLTAMTINYGRLATRYNELVARFNSLLGASQQTASNADRLQDQLAARDREIADLKRQMANAEVEWDVVCERLASSSSHYMERALAAEAELKALRSQQT